METNNDKTKNGEVSSYMRKGASIELGKRGKMLMYDFPQNNVQGLREPKEVTRRRYKKILWQDREV